MAWPLFGVAPALPPASGRFGAVRRHDVHTGVDLHAAEGSEVVAIEPGRVVAVVPFTGPAAGSPWWLPTRAVLVEDTDGVWVYGEVDPEVSVGDTVVEGQRLGTVARVLRRDKGAPTAMLHLERCAPGLRDPVWWRHGEPCPAVLQDPMPRLARRGHGPRRVPTDTSTTG